jgi:hypothetical protein
LVPPEEPLALEDELRERALVVLERRVRVLPLVPALEPALRERVRDEELDPRALL